MVEGKGGGGPVIESEEVVTQSVSTWNQAGVGGLSWRMVYSVPWYQWPGPGGYTQFDIYN